MFKPSIIAALVAVALSTNIARAEDHNHAASSEAHDQHHKHWSYTGEEGPEHWAEMDAKNAICSSGKNQSPVNLTNFTKADLKPIKFNYAVGGDEILNNGHTIQVNFAEGSAIELNGQRYNLKQFHAHAPSENQINGKSFPMELHFVHADANGELAVVAVMFEEGAANPGLAAAWKSLPTQAGEKLTLKENAFDTDLMPMDKSYYRFNGSLTTPPCSEGVTWLVLKHSVTASKAQIEQFAHLMHHENNRPIQALHARMIAE
jgi:carbonic anhydrase